MNQLVAWLWQGAVLAIVTTVAVRAVPPAAAGKRHFIWSTALVLTVALLFVDAFTASGSGGLQAAPAVPNRAGGLTFPLPPAWAILGALALWGVAATLHIYRRGYAGATRCDLESTVKWPGRCLSFLEGLLVFRARLPSVLT
jgi:hypothetical protein